MSKHSAEKGGLTYEQALPLVEALAFYARADTYHAVGFWFDPPCGEFSEDFTEDHGDGDYGRAMPGARARAALAAVVPPESPTPDAAA